MAAGTYSQQNGLITYSGWSGTTTAAKTLSFTASCDMEVGSGAGSSHVSASYTLDGSTWTSIFSSAAAFAATNYTVSIPSGQNLALVQVQFSCFSTVSRTGNNEADADLIISNLKIQ